MLRMWQVNEATLLTTQTFPPKVSPKWTEMDQSGLNGPSEQN